jgi:hypothetical protein
MYLSMNVQVDTVDIITDISYGRFINILDYKYNVE